MITFKANNNDIIFTLQGRTAGMPRGRSSQVHPGQECGPCHLCQQTSTHYSHLKTWEETAKKALTVVTPLGNEECICRKCEKEIKRNIENIHSGNYIPGQAPSRAAKCIVVGCSRSTTIINTATLTKERVSEVLGVEVIPGSASLVTPLCEAHYKQVYRAKSERWQKCHTCHSRIYGALRHCPDPKVINTYFLEMGNIDMVISEKDYVCTSCYNYHLTIVHHNETISRDDEFNELVERVKGELPVWR